MVGWCCLDITRAQGEDIHPTRGSRVMYLLPNDHTRQLSFFGTGTYGLLNGTAGRFQTGVAAILLLSRTTFLLLLPPELLLPLALLPLPLDPTLVVVDVLDLRRVGDKIREFLSPPLMTTSPPPTSCCEGVQEDPTLCFGLAGDKEPASNTAPCLIAVTAVVRWRGVFAPVCSPCGC